MLNIKYALNIYIYIIFFILNLLHTRNHINISNDMVLKRREGFYFPPDLTVLLGFTLAKGTVASFATLYFNR